MSQTTYKSPAAFYEKMMSHVNPKFETLERNYINSVFLEVTTEKNGDGTFSPNTTNCPAVTVLYDLLDRKCVIPAWHLEAVRILQPSQKLQGQQIGDALVAAGYDLEKATRPDLPYKSRLRAGFGIDETDPVWPRVTK